MHFEILTTPRLHLRRLTPEAYKFVFGTYSEEQLRAFFGHNTAEEMTKERLRFENGLTTFNKSFSNFQLIDKQTGMVVGGCGFHTWYLDHRRAEIGYHLYNDQFKNQGFMSEALPNILRYGFEEMNLNRVEAFIGANNVASLKLVEKLGFIKEGHLRQHYAKGDQIEDSILFSLLRSDFESGGLK